MNAEVLLILTVTAVGILHTMVPDHWAPIALVARQQGWSRGQTARAALGAGSGHVVSTLLIGLVVWVAGVAVAARFGHVVSTASSVALIGFGAWIAVTAWRELPENTRSDDDAAPRDEHDRPPHDRLDHHAHDRIRHVHAHRHAGGPAHVHVHAHETGTWHAITGGAQGDAPVHDHTHETSKRTALLLILGSSPMVEGIPAFFAAARYGPGLIAVMSAVFAVSTIVTYVVLCVYSTAGLQRVWLGPVERYGEVLSGLLVALVGVAFLIWPLM
jgi:hypothetical protein